jgi:uncharacterized integral membrane protein
MTPRGVLYGIVALVVLLLGSVAALFVLQNAARTTELSLNLGFAAWQLAEPLPIPALIGVSFGAGFLLATLLFGVRAITAGRRVRRLEQEAALNGERSPWR